MSIDFLKFRKIITIIVFSLFQLVVAQKQDNYDLNSGNGKGLRFWGGSNDYKIHMGNTSLYKYGPVQDFSMKFNMSNADARGWTWGRNGKVPIAGLNALGQFQIAGTFTSKSLSLSGGNTISSVHGFVNKVEFKGSSHGAIVFKPGDVKELMFGMHDNGNFYWGTGRSATKPNYYSMSLNGNTGLLSTKSIKTDKNIAIGDRLNIRTSSSTNNHAVIESLKANGNIYVRSKNSVTSSSSGNLILNDYGGRVGIGTANPKSDLEVKGGGLFNRIAIGDDPYGELPYVYESIQMNPDHNLRVNFGKTQQFVFTNTGRLGVGINRAPKTSLEVNGGGLFSSSIAIGDDPFGDLKYAYESIQLPTTHNLRVNFGSTQQFVFTNTGRLGIGTASPKNKLSVNGHIWAKEIKVKLTDGADWVFEEDYDLKSLAEVEKYIKENKHLPEIPSADDFRKNDMKVSEMTNKLLQKIEELTLYAIEQEKQLESQKKKNNVLEARLNKIEALLIK